MSAKQNLLDLKRIELAEYQRLMYFAFRKKKLMRTAAWRRKNPSYGFLWKNANKDLNRKYVREFFKRNPVKKRFYKRLQQLRMRVYLRRSYLRRVAKDFFKRAGLPVPAAIPESFLVEWIKPKLEIERYVRNQKQKAQNQTNESNSKYKPAQGPDYVRLGNQKMLKAA
jgi:hypothetical protein